MRGDGTFRLQPERQFLRTHGGSGVRTLRSDSFTYPCGRQHVTVNIALTGLDTDDTLLGTAGADVLAGGNGNDFYRVENVADLVLESVGAGQDGVYVAMHIGGYALAAGSEVEILAAIDPASTAALDLTATESPHDHRPAGGNLDRRGGNGLPSRGMISTASRKRATSSSRQPAAASIPSMRS